MDILLHICCGPCLIYPFDCLKKEFKIKGFYYNPNIYPLEEYARRKEALGRLEELFGFRVDYPLYDQDEYFNKIGNTVNKPERCALCYSLRLEKTAQYAKDNGFKSFSTTLLVSPYQDHARLKDCGLRLAKEKGLDFYYMDFRSGFKKAQEKAKLIGIYRQKYCGCRFSLNEN